MTDSEWSKFVEVPLSRFIEDFLPADDALQSEFTGVLDTTDYTSVDGVYRYWNQITTNIYASYTSSAVRTKLSHDFDVPDRIDGGLYVAGEAPADETHDWSRQRLSVTCVGEEEADIFASVYESEDEERADEYDEWAAERSKKVRDHLTKNAMHVFVRQQRCFHFTVFLRGLFARIIRWDRAGAVVTEKIGCKKQPQALRGFLWRFCRLTDEQQGHDRTAMRIEPGTEEYALMDWAAKNGSERPCALQPWDILERPRPLSDDERMDYARSTFEASLCEGWPRWKLPVCEDGPDRRQTMRWFLVCKPDANNPDLFTRGTRGYIALDCETKQFVFLKDVWRVHVRHTAGRREGETLRMLASQSVRNIPTVLCHGDVLGQRTVTYDYWTQTRHLRTPDEMMKELFHYRLVEREVGRPLALFEKSRDLLKILSDCLLAHEDAFTRSNLLHRDISIGNMLIIYGTDERGEVSPHGLLIDWEFSLPPSSETAAEARARGARQRIGTWSFLSVRSQNDPYKPLAIQDDLESFFYVLLFCAIHWLPSNCPDVSSFVKNFFDTSRLCCGDHICNGEKEMAVESGHIRVLFKDHMADLSFASHSNEQHPLNTIMAELLEWFGAHYRHILRSKNPPQPKMQCEVPERRDNPFLMSNSTRRYPRKLLIPLREPPQRIEHDRIMATRLESHTAMRCLFWAADEHLTWSDCDRIPDRTTFPIVEVVHLPVMPRQDNDIAPRPKQPASRLLVNVGKMDAAISKSNIDAPRPSPRKRVAVNVDCNQPDAKRTKRTHTATVKVRVPPQRPLASRASVKHTTSANPPSNFDVRAYPASRRPQTRSLRLDHSPLEVVRRAGHMILRSRPKQTQRFGC